MCVQYQVHDVGHALELCLRLFAGNVALDVVFAFADAIAGRLNQQTEGGLVLDMRRRHVGDPLAVDQERQLAGVLVLHHLDAGGGHGLADGILNSYLVTGHLVGGHAGLLVVMDGSNKRVVPQLLDLGHVVGQHLCLRADVSFSSECTADGVAELPDPAADLLEQIPMFLGQRLDGGGVLQHVLASIRDHLVHGLVISQRIRIFGFLRTADLCPRQVLQVVALFGQPPGDKLLQLPIALPVVLLDKVGQLMAHGLQHDGGQAISNRTSAGVDVDFHLVGAGVILAVLAHKRTVGASAALKQPDVDAGRLGDFTKSVDAGPLHVG